ncbi:hypothetical protein PRZ48_014285 [Zasmidium cellare]|uniref:NAD(P)-binding protein n=1 Tax=Zasmidium cellare TaxID=395010 RepID=A0ABR0E0J1_ZASCE|nr:hypothetical protein PRZ48_014285 [Zasmidium cellare]
MTSQHNTLVVFGSGPGIGRNVASLFVERGFSKVILLSRDASRLKEDASYVKSAAAGVSVSTVTIDLADTENVCKALGEVEKELGDTPLEAVLYNAARVGTSKILKFEAEGLERDLRISVVSLYIVAQWALAKLVSFAESNPSATPAFLVTSGGLYKNPYPALFSLAAGKAAQYNLTNSLHKEFEPKGVHCALIVVQGVVADDAKVTTARNIAEEAWKLRGYPRGEGKLDVVITDPDYVKKLSERKA